MTTRAKTKNYHMEAWNTDGSGKVQGAWTGKVKTSVKKSSIPFKRNPVEIVFVLKDNYAHAIIAEIAIVIPYSPLFLAVLDDYIRIY